MTLGFADPASPSLPLHVLHSDTLDSWLQDQPQAVRAWVAANGFAGGIGQALMVPGADGPVAMALAGLGDAKARHRQRFPLAAAVPALAAGTYHMATWPDDVDLDSNLFGWLISGYRFDRYRKAQDPATRRRLIAPQTANASDIETQVAAETLTRDLINTPAQDMGPAQLQAAAETLARAHGAQIDTITGDDLLAQNFPMIHTVGRAAAPDRAPRLIDLRWGDTGPQLTLVGKGVCFDTGGLNLKPGGSMGLMKKDMGGAANVLGLAQMIMAQTLPLRLRVLIPAVENAVAGDAFRPGDILTARNGLTVEVNNTDAEGRLVLADALALAAEDQPDLILSMATLTGAARVAVGPDLAPYYTDQPGIAAALDAAARAVADPVWRMPFHAPYEAMIEPGIADLDNAPGGGFAGSITAALFLRRFTADLPYLHFDIYGWQPSTTPARPKGGVAQGPRALIRALPQVLDL